MLTIKKILTKAIFCLSFLLFTQESSGQEDASIIKVGDQLPEFSITADTGILKSSDLKGKVVLLNFFATWCPPCIKELPYVKERIWEKYKDHKDFELMVIGRNHSLEEMRRFKAEKFDLPIYSDPDRDVYGKFALNTIPRNYVVDKSGKIIYASIGFSLEEFEEMLSIIEKHLSKE